MSTHSAAPAPDAVYLSGAVDDFIAPGVLSGWVTNSSLSGKGLDIRVSVRIGDRLVAEGSLTHPRPDVVSSVDHLAAFRLVCREDIPDELIAFDLLRIEARDDAGRTCELNIWEPVRAFAFDRLFKSTTPLGKCAASALLLAVEESPDIDRKARAAIRQIHDLHFEEENRRLLFQFESLGKDCSLGGLQRAFGAEPLGLLRFAGIDVDAVIDALNGRFEGVGSPDFTTIAADHTGEFYTSDARYGMSSHTFIYEGDVDFERFCQQQYKKIRFLVRNMLEKLQEGDRIFVVHDIPDEISDAKLHALLAAIRRIGPARLLYLRAAGENNADGTCKMRDDGIMEGSVLPIEGVESAPENRASWLTVCRKAQAMIVDRATENAP
jgi:hypothetical protein